MTVPLRTRADLKTAGRSMATEVVVALSRRMLGLSEAELRDEQQIEVLVRAALASAENVAADYRAAGIPEPWVRKFLSAFTLRLAEDCRTIGFILRPVAGNA